MKAIPLYLSIVILCFSQDKPIAKLITQSGVLPEYTHMGEEFLKNQFQKEFDFLSEDKLSFYLDSIRSDRTFSKEITKQKIEERFGLTHELEWKILDQYTEVSKVIWYPFAGDKTMTLTIQARLKSSDSTLVQAVYKADTTEREWFCGGIECEIPEWNSEQKSRIRKTLLKQNLASFAAEVKSALEK